MPFSDTRGSSYDESWQPAPKSVLALFSRGTIAYFGCIALLALCMGLGFERLALKEFDARLAAAVQSLPELLPPDFADRAVTLEALSPEEELENRRSLGIVAQAAGIKHLYTLFEYQGKLYFTSFVFIGESIGGQRWYFTPYEDAPPEMHAALQHMQPAHFSYADTWGSFRAYVEPHASPGGVRWLAGADIGMNAVSEKTRQYLLIGISILVICALAALPGLWAAYRARHAYAAYSRRMRLLAESTLEGILALDGDDRIRYANRAALNLLGYGAANELLARGCLEALRETTDAPEKDTPAAALGRMLEKSDAGMCDCRFRRKDGQIIQAEAFFTPVPEKDSPFRRLIFFRDVTASRNMQTMTEAIYRASTDAHVIWQDGRLVECSPTALALFKMPDSRAMEENMLRFAFSPPFQPDGSPSSARRHEFLQRALKTGFERFEWLYADSEGTPLPCEVTCIRMLYNGRTALFICVRDLRTLKQSEDNLRGERRQLLNILNNSPIGIGIYSADRQELRFTNTRLHELLNVRLGASLDSIFLDPADQAALRRALAQGRGHVTDYPIRLAAADGAAQKDFLFSCAPMRYEDRDCLLGWLMDITTMREAEAALTAARDAAEEATHAKSDFLARMSHEIRTPMNGILGMTYLALLQDPQPKIRDYLDKIQFSAGSLLGIINDILDFSKIEAGRLDIEYIPFRLREQVESIRDVLADKLADKKLDLAVEIAPDIPETIVGDPLRLRQILLNLLSNAVKFTPAGGIRLTVVPQGTANDALLFTVSDTGIGMTREQLSHIFESFSQADGSITRTYGGTGLGLAITKALVELMGGKIEVESSFGQGSAFSFSLPLPRAEDARTAQAARIPEPAKKESMENARLLLVEDNEINREIALELLGMLGFSVDVAENGAEAVEAVRNRDYDLVLMDIQMPVMDGFAAARKIRALDKPGVAGLPIVAMTANAMSEDRGKCLDAGMNDHIAKPINPELLYTTLKHWLRGGRAEPESATAGIHG